MTPRRTLLVTGASAGIGAATAIAAAEAGWDVALGYRSDQGGVEATQAACQTAGARTVLIQADLSLPDEIDSLWATFDAAFPRLDALMNNAGIIDLPARVDEIEAPRLRRLFDTNLIGPILMAGRAVRRMSTRHGGHGGVIVNLSSAAARIGAPGQYVDYAASKSGIDALTKGLGDEVAAEGIRVVGLRPGIIDTPIHAKGGLPDRARDSTGLIPMRRAGTAAEVAATAVWLISDSASYITSTTIDVTGGR